jgi:hypothetical protein
VYALEARQNVDGFRTARMAGSEAYAEHGDSGVFSEFISRNGSDDDSSEMIMQSVFEGDDHEE